MYNSYRDIIDFYYSLNKIPITVSQSYLILKNDKVKRDESIFIEEID